MGVGLQHVNLGGHKHSAHHRARDCRGVCPCYKERTSLQVPHVGMDGGQDTDCSTGSCLASGASCLTQPAAPHERNQSTPSHVEAPSMAPRYTSPRSARDPARQALSKPAFAHTATKTRLFSAGRATTTAGFLLLLTLRGAPGAPGGWAPRQSWW